jgi:hypothetical protein
MDVATRESNAVLAGVTIQILVVVAGACSWPPPQPQGALGIVVCILECLFHFVSDEV